MVWLQHNNNNNNNSDNHNTPDSRCGGQRLSAAGTGDVLITVVITVVVIVMVAMVVGVVVGVARVGPRQAVAGRPAGPADPCTRPEVPIL